MQSVWQKCIDASISSTVNLPYEATPEDVFNIYVDAWKAGLKGITVFRDGCRRASILSTGVQNEEKAVEKLEALVNEKGDAYKVESKKEEDIKAINDSIFSKI